MYDNYAGRCQGYRQSAHSRVAAFREKGRGGRHEDLILLFRAIQLMNHSGLLRVRIPLRSDAR
jgi:hypothetical protein